MGFGEGLLYDREQTQKLNQPLTVEYPKTTATELALSPHVGPILKHLKPGNAATVSLPPCGSPMHVGGGGSSLPTHQKPSASGTADGFKG